MNLKRLCILAPASVILAMLVTGFVFGFISAPVSLLGRIVMGTVYAFLTIVSLGFPPEALEDHAQPYNLWPYIIVFGLFFLVWA
jgi:hypothetical protein